MKLANLSVRGRLRLGVEKDGRVIDAAALAAANGVEDVPSTVDAAVRDSSALPRLRQLVERAGDGPWCQPVTAATFGPCVSAPQKIVCIGLNYRRHAQETGQPVPTVPVVFSKYANTLTGHGRPIELPSGALEFDYEVELGVVIGRAVRDVSVDRALDAVFGYCTCNDFSARDLQFRTSQWLLGKTCDDFMPAGPWLVTADDVPDPQSLQMRCWVNGEVRQDSNTGDMVFGVAELVSYLSRHMTLHPGDLISTGTPEGVALGRKPPPWVRAGDVVAVEIERLGRLENRFVAPAR